MKKALFIFALFAFLAIANSVDLDNLRPVWSAWKLKYRKYYTPSEDVLRLGIFVQNLIKIQEMNAENTGVTYAINQFADLTADEFKMKYTNKAFYDPNANLFGDKTYQSSVKVGDLPDSVDWRQKGAVTPIKNQGNCGSCWAFSSVGLLESFYFINNGKLENLSMQQIIECAHDAGYGCQGGWPYLALDYACKYGLEREADYPYTAKDSEQCHYEQSKALKVCGGHKFVNPKSTDSLKAALVETPASVLVEADQSVFQFYRGGVITTSCGANLNHAVLAVGYQKVGALEAFIVKNSWGADWGDKGYVLISTIQQINNGQGVCGILSQPVVATK